MKHTFICLSVASNPVNKENIMTRIVKFLSSDGVGSFGLLLGTLGGFSVVSVAVRVILGA